MSVSNLRKDINNRAIHPDNLTESDMRTIGTDEPTAASVWRSVAGTRVEDHLLEWPPDVFALTDTLLGRSEAYRFALSPPDEAEWPPSEVPGWPDAVVDVGRQWSSWVEDRHAQAGPRPGAGCRRRYQSDQAPGTTRAEH